MSEPSNLAEDKVVLALQEAMTMLRNRGGRHLDLGDEIGDVLRRYIGEELTRHTKERAADNTKGTSPDAGG